MVPSCSRRRVTADRHSYVVHGLQCDIKGNRMPVPSQTQGVVPRPVTPHSPTCSACHHSPYTSSHFQINAILMARSHTWNHHQSFVLPAVAVAVAVQHTHTHTHTRHPWDSSQHRRPVEERTVALTSSSGTQDAFRYACLIMNFFFHLVKYESECLGCQLWPHYRLI